MSPNPGAYGNFRQRRREHQTRGSRVPHHRLPATAWWDNYYGPLRKNIASFKNSNDSMMQTVIRDTEEEMKYFKEYEEIYGYSFYIMKAV